MSNFRDIRCSVSALEYGSGLSFNGLQCAKVIRKIFVNILVGTAASVGSNFNTMRLETPISLYYYVLQCTNDLQKLANDARPPFPAPNSLIADLITCRSCGMCN